MEDQIKKLRKIFEDGISVFQSPVDIPMAVLKLDLESRSGDPSREFKHIHQNCLFTSMDFEIASKIRTLLLIEGYLALYDKKSGLPLYAITRSIIELHGLILNVQDKLTEFCKSDPKNWRHRGESFFRYLIKARYGTRDTELISRFADAGYSKRSLSPIPSSECLSSLFDREEFVSEKQVYEKLCDFVHTNSQGYYVGSSGWLMADKINLPDGKSIKLADKMQMRRYQYPVEEKFTEAVEYTASTLYKHVCGIINALNHLPETPYSEAECMDQTGNKRGYVEISHQQNVVVPPRIDGSKIGRNDPCPCGSGKKFKNCHLN